MDGVSLVRTFRRPSRRHKRHINNGGALGTSFIPQRHLDEHEFHCLVPLAIWMMSDPFITGVFFWFQTTGMIYIYFLDQENLYILLAIISFLKFCVGHLVSGSTSILQTGMHILSRPTRHMTKTGSRVSLESKSWKGGIQQ